ncbi:hypothetical protein DFH07DRAFT_998824 [Mycena maculata]|uniref:F-box domain-containing protein n=1 Tax=Mycena maculata TaxID=230809 RepID=A0AAD7MQK5_9AGAR|nr:hypothetical protein DFH07DRAFT_998824 [Mycena maculata]
MHPLQSASPLCTVPAEILEQIAYELTCLTPLGPPAALVPLLLTCKTVHGQLAGNATLFARIFRFKFDASAVRRRAFDPTPAQYFDQLVLYCTQLQKLRGPVLADCDDVLFSAYLMMLENDGRNAAQLTHAGLDSYLDVFVRTRMWDKRYSSHGWPTDNVASACGLWLMWMTTTAEKLRDESVERRNQIIELVLPYVLVPYRYASTLAPQNHFTLPLSSTPTDHTTSIVTAHGPYPVYLDPRRAWSQVHFSARPTLVPPLVTVAAKLVYFSRRETVPFSIPPHLPRDRAAARAAGITHVGPNQDDIHEVNAHLNARLPEVRLGWGACDGDAEPLSARWDPDWCRLRKCFSAWRVPDARLGTPYQPGTFTGLWQGRMLIPSEHHFSALVTTHDYPAAFDEGYLGTTTVPLFMRIQEHHSYAPHRPAPCGGAGPATAYFPRGTRIVPNDARSVDVRVPDDDEGYEYATFGAPGSPRIQSLPDAPGAAGHDAECAGCRAREEALRGVRARRAAAAHEALFARVGLGAPAAEADEGEDEEEGEGPRPALDPDRVPPCNGIQDIIFTGATDTRHGAAWNHFEFFGRLRAWDGMIGILRVSVLTLRVQPDPRLGTLFFYGFVVAGHRFVGNWRVAHQDLAAPAYESAFTMARREDE